MDERSRGQRGRLDLRAFQHRLSEAPSPCSHWEEIPSLPTLANLAGLSPGSICTPKEASGASCSLAKRWS